jgi:hypothetical protein
MHGEIRNAYGFWLGNLKERDHSVDLGIDGVSMDFNKEMCELVDWIYLTLDSDR